MKKTYGAERFWKHLTFHRENHSCGGTKRSGQDDTSQSCGRAGGERLRQICTMERKDTFQRMTMVFQKPCMISSTVRKNIAWPLKIRGAAREEAAAEVERLAEKLGLTSFLDRRADRLSAGEIEKTALARALSFDPDLLLLDEPGANMDPHALIEMEAMLRRLPAERQKTVLLVTHNLAQAARLADDVLFLNEGRAVEHCGVKEFFECPAREETKRFLEIEWR